MPEFTRERKVLAVKSIKSYLLASFYYDKDSDFERSSLELLMLKQLHTCLLPENLRKFDSIVLGRE